MRILEMMFLFFFALVPVIPQEPAGAVRVVPAGVLADARQPQAAVDANGNIYVVYGSKNSIYCSVSRDRAKSFAAPTKVGETGALALGMRRGPRVAATERHITVTAVGGDIGGGKDGDVFCWRSQDGGLTWSGASKVNDSPASAREGLHALAVGPTGKLACVWLDLRNHKTEIYGSFSDDGGASWSANKLIYHSPGGSVCECCHPSAAFDDSGVLYVMWRNQLEGARDMYLTESRDGGSSFSEAVKIGLGSWPLKACPMDGGAVSARAGQVSTIWRRGSEIYRTAAGKGEELLGGGVQPWGASAGAGAFFVWIDHRPGDLHLLTPESGSSRIIATKAADPVIAAPVTGSGPIVAVWESVVDGPSAIFAAQVKSSR